MPTPPDERSRIAKAWDRASQITGISLSMVVPGVIGYGLDIWLKWPWVLTILGFAFGMTFGMYQLVRFAQKMQKNTSAKDETSDPK